jgi:hypothetical protein
MILDWAFLYWLGLEQMAQGGCERGPTVISFKVEFEKAWGVIPDWFKAPGDVAGITTETEALGFQR